MNPPSPSVRRPDVAIGVLRSTVKLGLLFGLTWLSLRVAPGVPGGGGLALLLGFVLLSASVAGVLAGYVGLPKLTGFILVGIAAGPSLLGIIPSGALEDLRLIDQFALALIAMLAGGELRLDALKPQARTIAVTTLVVTGIVWLGMAAAVLAMRPMVPFLAAMPLPAAVGVALLFGVWAANSSPDLTVAVIEERHAKGPLVEVILGITIVKDVLVIVLFTLTLALVTPLLDPASSFSWGAVVKLGQEVGGALILGGAAGWVFSQYLGGEGENPRSPLATFLFAYVLVVLAHELHVELLLTGVAAGFVIENLSPAGDRMIQGIRSVAVVIFAFFFAIAGAGLDLAALLRFGAAALVLFLARVFLTRLATVYGTKRAGAGPAVQRLAWRGLISQGGVSLSLVLVIGQAFPEIGGGVSALAMAVIIGNMLAGPVLLGQALADPEAKG